MPDIAMFLVAAVALTLAPGPDNIYVLTRGIAQGRSAALMAAGGFASGLVVHSLLAVLGFAAVIKASPAAYMLLRYAGALYLLYLGWRMLSSTSAIVMGADNNALSYRRLYWQSVVASALNPKVSVFFIAFLPQFVNEQAGNTVWQMGLLALLFIVQAWIIFSIIALFSGMIGSYLQRHLNSSTYLNRLAGCAFIGLGIRMVLPE
jgi:threonine/homoserine/homoserine lactone efflux protein